MINIAIQKDNYKKKDGTYSLRILLSAKGKQAKILLPYSFPDGYWKDGKITKEFRGRGKIEWNVIIQKHVNDMQDFLLKKEAHKYSYTPAEIKQMWLSQGGNNVDFIEYYKKEIERLKKLGKKGSHRARQETLSKLTAFRSRIYFSDLTPKFLEDFNEFMSGLRPNSRGKHFRQLKAVINRAKTIDNIIMPDAFSRFKMPRERTEKKNLTIAQLKAIRDLTLTDRLKYSRDFFLFQFLMAGMSFSDVYYLPPAESKYVTYRRHKIGEEKDRMLLKIIVPDAAKRFLKTKRSPTTYNNQLRWMKWLNKDLKIIAEMAGINAKVSTNYARHSWATIAKRNGYSSELRKEIMGHRNYDMQQIYADEFRQKQRDKCVLHIASLLD